MKTYNKLVRDKIPQIIEANGKQCDVRVLDDAEYEIALKAKMQEEVIKFLEATERKQQLEELSDLLEVIYSIAQCKGISQKELDCIRKKKVDERRGFQKMIFLISTEYLIT